MSCHIMFLQCKYNKASHGFSSGCIREARGKDGMLGGERDYLPVLPMRCTVRMGDFIDSKNTIRSTYTLVNCR